MPLYMKVRAVSVDKKMRQAMRSMPRATHRFAEWTIGMADPYVPYRTGALASNVAVEDHVKTFERKAGRHDHARTAATHYASHVIYKQHYARHLYFGVKHPVFGIDVGTVFRLAKKYDESQLIQYSRAVHPKAQPYWYYGAQVDHMVEYEAKMAELVQEEFRRKGL